MAKHNHPPKSGGLIKGKCPECGGILEINKEKDAAICPYCGMPYIVEKAINNYIETANISHVQNISAQVVNVNISNEKAELSREEQNAKLIREIDIKMDRAETLIEQGKYDSAKVLCETAILSVRCNPDIQRRDMWWNLFIAYTQNLTRLDVTKKTVESFKKCLDNVRQFGPISPEYEDKIECYFDAIKKEKQKRKTIIENKKQQLKELKKEYVHLHNKDVWLFCASIVCCIVTCCLFFFFFENIISYIVSAILFVVFIIAKSINSSKTKKVKEKLKSYEKNLDKELIEFEMHKGREIVNDLLI